MLRFRVDEVQRLWKAFDRIGPARDLAATLLHPYALGEGENLSSRIQSALFVSELSFRVRRFASPFPMRDWVVGQASPRGLFLEFGVAGGESANQIARKLATISPGARLFGFDSFLGLPEPWRQGVDTGRFAQLHPPLVEKNVTLLVGLFEDTLPGFLSSHDGSASFVHIDADLYSSAHCVLSLLLSADRLRPGAIILFDELFNYPGWTTNGEYRALRELFPTSTLDYEPMAIVPLFQQVGIRLVDASNARASKRRAASSAR